jgi:hypothetical protein
MSFSTSIHISSFWVANSCSMDTNEGGGVEVLPHEVEDVVPHHGEPKIPKLPEHRGQTPRQNGREPSATK